MTTEILPPGTLVLFGRPNGEKTRGKVIKRLPSGKYKVEQLEARGGHRVGTPWTVPANFLTKIGGQAPVAPVVPATTAIGQVRQFNEAAFAAKASILGLPADCFGKTFTAKGTQYRITGLHTNRPKFPVDAERVRDGMAFKFRVDGVLRSLGLPVAPKTVTVVTGLLVPSTTSLVGSTFRFRGRVYEITGYTPSRPKYPYSAKRLPDGKRFKFDEASVTAGLLPGTGKAATPATKRPESAILADIKGVYGDLSPENLTWDGERSRSEVVRASAALTRKLRELFAELGREVDESEAWSA